MNYLKFANHSAGIRFNSSTGTYFLHLFAYSNILFRYFSLKGPKPFHISKIWLCVRFEFQPVWKGWESEPHRPHVHVTFKFPGNVEIEFFNSSLLKLSIVLPNHKNRHVISTVWVILLNGARPASVILRHPARDSHVDPTIKAISNTFLVQ